MANELGFVEIEMTMKNIDFNPFLVGGIPSPFLSAAARAADKKNPKRGDEREKIFENELCCLLGGDADKALRVIAEKKHIDFFDAPPHPGDIAEMLVNQEINVDRLVEKFDGDFTLLAVNSKDNHAIIGISARLNADKAISTVADAIPGQYKIVCGLAPSDIILLAHKKLYSDSYTELKKALRELENSQAESRPPTLVGKTLISILKHAAFSGASDLMFNVNGSVGVIKLKRNGVSSLDAETDSETMQSIIRVLLSIANINEDKYKRPYESVIDFSFNERGTNNVDDTINDIYELGRLALAAFRFRAQVCRPRPQTDSSAINIVLRILRKNASNVSLDRLGYDKKALDILKESIQRPRGLILFAGPTGSGKSTSADALLCELDPIRKWIVSVENPVEYPHTLFVQYEPPHNDDLNESFLDIIKSFLRSNPDVCFFGECREQKIAERLVELSLTGSLVISTVHAGSVAQTFQRLDQWGISSQKLSEVLIAIINQSLIPKNCELCNNDKLQRIGCCNCGGLGVDGVRLSYEILPVDDKFRKIIRRTIGIHEEMDVLDNYLVRNKS